MKETTRKFLNLMFDPEETICVSHHKYGYHSIDQNDINGDIRLISPNDNIAPKTITEDDIVLCGINPISGFRRDENVTAFRSFLLEIDEGSIKEQMDYIKNSEVPYSICVFSGNKSLHFGIVLDKPFKSITVWRMYNQWILNILNKTDQQNVVPSRSIRFPGNKRNDGKKMKQALVEIKSRVSQEDLKMWLNKYPEQKPKPPERKLNVNKITGLPNLDKISQETWEILEQGVHTNRNETWFKIGIEFAKTGMDYEQAVSKLEEYFIEEKDFRKREWKTCLKSAFKRVQGM